MSTNSGFVCQPSHQSFPQQDRPLTRIVAMLTVLGISVFFYFPAYATQDLIAGANITVYFEKDKKPHDKPVDFTISCYGYWTEDPVFVAPWIDVPEEGELFSFSGTCDHYGCAIDVYQWEPWFEVTHWDCEGETEGEEFVSVYYPTPSLDIKYHCLPDPDYAKDHRLRPIGYGSNVCLRVFELTFDISTSFGSVDDGGGGGG